VAARRSVRPWLLAPISVASMALGGACTSVLGLGDVPTPVDASAGDATMGDSGARDGSADGHQPPDGGSPCMGVVPPGPPNADDPSDAGDQTFVAAAQAVDYGVRQDGGPAPLYGFDLDKVFTCCQGGPESCHTTTMHCDEDGGRDNSGGQLIASFTAQSPGSFSQDQINQRIAAGLFTMLVQVQHYNGTANDTSVAVGAFASTGFEADAGSTPRWDGTDTWAVDSTYVLGSTGLDAGTPFPAYFDSKAYVVDGNLVAFLDQLPVVLGPSGANRVIVKLQSAWLVGSVVKAGQPGQYALSNAQVAGRWSTGDLLAQMPWVFVLGQFVCPGTSIYSGLKNVICPQADVNADPALDNTSNSCNALSFGLGFSASPAHLGALQTPLPSPVNCGDANTDDCP
jgi:hypothetical protein